MTKVNAARDYAVRAASDKLKVESGSNKVPIEFRGNRGVLVNGTLAFEQGTFDITGRFLSPYTHLSLD